MTGTHETVARRPRLGENILVFVGTHLGNPGLEAVDILMGRTES